MPYWMVGCVFDLRVSSGLGILNVGGLWLVGCIKVGEAICVPSMCQM